MLRITTVCLLRANFFSSHNFITSLVKPRNMLFHSRWLVVSYLYNFQIDRVYSRQERRGYNENDNKKGVTF